MANNFVPPGQQRYLRACMVCSIVMTLSVSLSSSSLRIRSHTKHGQTGPLTRPSSPPSQRFRTEGCPNCDDFLHLKNDNELVDSCTSQVFEGLITLADPSKSWVAKWQRLDQYGPGVYAIKVSGQLPDEIRTALEEEHRITYIP
jgi:transcription elongation factor SPT4